MKKNIFGALIVILLIFIDTFVSCKHLKPEIAKDEIYDKSEIYRGDLSALEEGKVIRIIDGDTFVCDINNKQTTIRLIGVDTPESVHSDESKNTEEGKIASLYTKSLLDEQTVYLEYDVSVTDYYGRTLAYVYLEDSTMLQEILLREGYAKLMTVQPNSKYESIFLKLEQKAKDEGKGFWEDYFKGEQ